MKQLIRAIGAIPLFCLFSINVYANCLDQPRLTGVNLAGAEFNSKSLPGIMFKNYTYPSSSEMVYIAEQGANVIRLPFRWERIQHTPKGELDSEQLNAITKTVAAAKQNGLCVVLDMHNYAKFGADSLEDNKDLQDAFVDAWLRIAKVFDDPEATAFDLMNEPINLPVAQWETLAKRTLAELRKADAKNLVFIEGGHWAGLHDWFKEYAGTSNADAFADLSDPLNRTIIEVHQYADEYYSGSGTECHPPEHFDTMFQRITAWAREHKQKLWLGEFGVPQNQNCLATLDHMLSLMTDEAAWKGWTYWAGGSWWGNYPLAVNTRESESPAPQWDLLKHYFYGSNPPNPPGPIE